MTRPPKIAVVIPFFQRQPGLIEACVRSVLTQQGATASQVIVVDDGSPSPAAPELAPLRMQYPALQVVEQANAGPGAARNRGLDQVEPDTDLVAFVDSDDCWDTQMLATALVAFEAGADFFFGNSRRFGQEQPRFDWTYSSGQALVPQRHRLIDRDLGLYQFDGDFFDFAIQRSAVISTSTLVYRFAKFPRLRFNPELFNGQDRFFKLQLSQAATMVTFSTRVCATEGQGVNIFDSAGWGSDKSLNLVFNYIKLSKAILRDIPLDDAQRSHVRQQLAKAREDFASALLHQLRAGRPLPSGLLRRAFAADPMSAIQLVPNTLRAGLRKLAR